MPPFHMARRRAGPEDNTDNSYPARRHLTGGYTTQARHIRPPWPREEPADEYPGYRTRARHVRPSRPAEDRVDDYPGDYSRGPRPTAAAANMWVNTQGDATKITIESCRPQHQQRGQRERYGFEPPLFQESPTARRTRARWDDEDDYPPQRRSRRRTDDDRPVESGGREDQGRPGWPSGTEDEEGTPQDDPLPGGPASGPETRRFALVRPEPVIYEVPTGYSERINVPMSGDVNVVEPEIRVEEPQTVEGIIVHEEQQDRRETRVYVPDSDVEDSASSFNDFRLVGQPGETDQERDANGFGVDSKPGVVGNRPVPGPQHRMDISNKEIIYSAFYDSGEDSGELIATLTTKPETARRSSRADEPLYRWIHLEGAHMDFDAFMTAARDARGIVSKDQHAILKVLKRIRKQAEKVLRTSQGNRGRYMVPTLLQECNISNSRSEAQVAPDQIVTCVCLPYFLLKPYAANDLPERSPLHPARTLMQFLHGSARRERDLQQAVCQISSTPKGSCFHVAEYWALVLNNGLILTAANVSQKTANKQSVVHVGHPTDRSSHILVTDSNGSRWQIPKDKSQTWLSFTSHFLSGMVTTNPYDRETVASLFKIYYENDEITAEKWPQVLAMIQQSNVSLTLVYESYGTTGQKELWASSLHLPESDEATLNLATERVTSQDTHATETTHLGANAFLDKTSPSPEMTNARAGNKECAPQRFHVFSWAVGEKVAQNQSENNPIKTTVDHSGTENSVPPTSSLQTALLEVHAYLLNSTSSAEKDLYQRAADLDWASISETFHSTMVLRDTEHGFVWFMHSAKVIFDFFLPAGVDSIISRKYWGGVQYAMNYRREQNSGHDTELSEVANVIHYINGQLTGGLPADLNLPDEFQRAFLHILMYFAVSQADGSREITHRDARRTTRRATAHLDKSQDMLKRGWVKLLKSLASGTLQSKAVIGPETVMSLLVRNLITDITQDHPDVSATYEEYFQQIEFDLQARPLKRSHQGKLTALKQEIEAITKVLAQQRQVLTDLLTAVTTPSQMLAQRSGRYDRSRRGPGAPYDKPNADAMILGDALAFVEYRIDFFAEMDARASELEAWNLRQIDSNKDRQEAAIYAFTIVTIIFLPLSFVAGFLGMNTTDIRDMELSQWVFWAAGVPLTVVIIVVSLAWAGEITSAWDGWLGMWRGMRERGRRPVWSWGGSGEFDPELDIIARPESKSSESSDRRTRRGIRSASRRREETTRDVRAQGSVGNGSERRSVSGDFASYPNPSNAERGEVQSEKGYVREQSRR